MAKGEIDPPTREFTIFSGGGGLVLRGQELELPVGESDWTVRNVPASFDPETLMVGCTPPGGGTGDGGLAKDIELKQLILKKPVRKYVDDSLRRDSEVAARLVNESRNLSVRRGEILEVCEDIIGRTYLDEESDVLVTFENKGEEPLKVDVKVAYFVNDGRFDWKPSVTVDLQDVEGWKGKAKVQGFLATSNRSAHRYEEIEILFADFGRDDLDFPMETTDIGASIEMLLREAGMDQAQMPMPAAAMAQPMPPPKPMAKKKFAKQARMNVMRLK